MNRRLLLQAPLAGAALRALGAVKRQVPVALVQFDAIPEQVDRNLGEMERLASEAVRRGARWVMFHEGSVCDYTPRLDELAEAVPAGKCTRRMIDMARRLRCHICFGLSETDRGRYYITQVFVGPRGFVYRYRKTWIWHDRSDKGYRDEWVRYDPGTGPELFEIDGVRAICFICADGDSLRCLKRAAALHPQLVFYPNNRGSLPDFAEFGARARTVGAPMLVTNRVGNSWEYPCKGGCVAYAADGTVLAKANREGREEILLCDIAV